MHMTHKLSIILAVFRFNNTYQDRPLVRHHDHPIDIMSTNNSKLCQLHSYVQFNPFINQYLEAKT